MTDRVTPPYKYSYMEGMTEQNKGNSFRYIYYIEDTEEGDTKNFIQRETFLQGSETIATTHQARDDEQSQ